jgi:subtilase family serine protease
MGNRSKRNGTGTGTGRPSFLSRLLGRAVAPAGCGGWTPADEGPAPIMEELEPRELLSAVPVATPNFLLYRGPGSLQPAATTSPAGLSPSVVRQAYGISQVMFGTVAGDGSGQTIAIVDAYNDPNIVADLHAFDVQFGLSDPILTRIAQDGTTNLPGTDPSGRGNSWALEISLDVEWAHVVAPSANILLVEARSASQSDLLAAINTARRYAGVSVISMSWGSGETSTSYDSSFTTPAGHNGVTFVASSGDGGAYGTGSHTMSVEFPAVSRNVLSVGGTRLTVDSNGNYVTETGWGNGTSSRSAGGSGGGVSRYEAQPAWQAGVVTQNSTFRAVPDVAMDADPASGVAVYDSWDSSTAPWFQVGGTSLAAPMWAGVIAIADQGRVLNGLSTLDGATQTLPMLYSLPSTDFHDILTGNNGYATGPGFDLVTGRGTPIVNKLVLDLAGITQITPPPNPTPFPTIGSLTISPASVVAGGTVTLAANGATDPSGPITSVAFYQESDGVAGLQIGADALLGTGVLSGGVWALTTPTAGLAPGIYTYYAVATDGAGVSSSPASGLLTVLSSSISNDSFAAATPLTGLAVTVTGTNVGATKEAGEPNIAGNAGGKSVWYTWTAQANGKVALTTQGSSVDTLLGVYTGSTVSSLALVASNDDVSRRNLTSAVTFTAVAGTTYRIAVDGYRGASGNITLNLSEAVAPAMDSFANALVLSGSTFTWTGTNVAATREVGEPFQAGNRGGASVWIAWTAPATRTVTLNTHGSNFDTLLAVYTGSSVATLTQVAGNDDDPSRLYGYTSALTFNAVAGQTYYIAVDGYNGATGNILLNLQ